MVSQTYIMSPTNSHSPYAYTDGDCDIVNEADPNLNQFAFYKFEFEVQ